MNSKEFNAARKKLELSVPEMANALSDPDTDNSTPVNRRTIYRWESGSKRIPGPVVVAVTLMLKFK